MRMNSGIGVSEKFITAAALLRTSWLTPASPQRNSTARIRLMAMNENATGMPTNSRTVEPPSSSSAAICHDIGRLLGGRDRVLARPPLALRKAVHAKHELDRQQ